MMAFFTSPGPVRVFWNVQASTAIYPWARSASLPVPFSRVADFHVSEPKGTRLSSEDHFSAILHLSRIGKMRILIVSFAALALSCAIVAAPRQAHSDAAEIDTAHSTMTVHVFKTGLFSALGHNHEISAPIESGRVQDKVQPSGNPSVELRVDARKLRVLDPDTSDDTRAQIQKTMLGPDVLDSDRFPEIRFVSTAVEASGANHWTVHGNLDLHGQSHPVTVDVALKDGTYHGSAPFKQTEFGIKPVSVAGGTVKIKDEVKVDFEISLVK